MPRAVRLTTAPGLAPREPVAVPATRTTLVLRWSLSREAAAGAGLVEGGDDGVPMLELCLAWDGPVHGVQAALVNGSSREELRLEGAAAGAWVADSASGLRHLDLPGLVRVTARAVGAGVEVLYARTEVLGRLGLAGGRYDFEGGELAAG